MTEPRVVIAENSASPALRKLLSQMDDGGTELLYNHYGEYMLRSTHERAEREVDPSGQKWAALEPTYAREKAKKRPGVPILKFDFHMLGDQLAYQADSQEMLLGSSAPYAAAHQGGAVIQRHAHSRKLSFAKDRPNGMKRFAKPGSKNVDHEKWATIGAYEVRLPARPFLGVSAEDETELLDITVDHLDVAFEGD